MSGHKFDPAKRQTLKSEKRRALLPPEMVLQQIGIGTNTIWADVGCGTGFFTIPLAGLVHKVYAFDIRTEMLEELTEALEQADLTNVETIQSQESVFPLKDEMVDGAFTSLVMHEVDNPLVFCKELSRILKVGGRLVVIEWEKVPTEMGPPLEHRISTEQLDLWIAEAGLTRSREWHWSNCFVGIEYRKNS